MRHVGLLLLCLLPLLPLHAADAPLAVKQYVANAKTNTDAATIPELLAALDDPATLIIDVREAAELEAGRVAGAINIPRGTLEFKIWSLLGETIDWDRPILLYCQLSGRAALAAQALQSLGLRNVRYVQMTFEEWTAAGHPIDF